MKVGRGFLVLERPRETLVEADAMVAPGGGGAGTVGDLLSKTERREVKVEMVLRISWSSERTAAPSIVSAEGDCMLVEGGAWLPLRDPFGGMAVESWVRG